MDSKYQAGAHLAQIYYFSAFCVVSSVSHLVSLSNVRKFLVFVRDNVLLVVTFFGLSAFILWNFSYAHRYLLADNRHYTFYIWSKILNRHKLVRLLLIPGYLFTFWCVDSSLKHKSVVWRSLYYLCVFVTLVPSTLLELRYFIAPYLLWRLNVKFSSPVSLLIELALNVFINAVTLYVFLRVTFSWPDSNELQRFMW